MKVDPHTRAPQLLCCKGENVVVGGQNRWAYDKFVNYDFFPSESFPILVYFKVASSILLTAYIFG